jgi:CubicO group peptidase (beta-lactamase class C family)
VKPKYLLSIAGLYSTAQDYMRFAQMLANRGTLDGVQILSPTSVKLMTTNLLPEGVPMHFLQPFAGIGYGMNVGIVLDPSHASFNGGANGAGTFYWGGCTEPGSGSIPPMTSSPLECSSNKTGEIQ